MQSKLDSKVAGDFWSEGTLELITQNFYWPDVEINISKDWN